MDNVPAADDGAKAQTDGTGDIRYVFIQEVVRKLRSAATAHTSRKEVDNALTSLQTAMTGIFLSASDEPGVEVRVDANAVDVKPPAKAPLQLQLATGLVLLMWLTSLLLVGAMFVKASYCGAGAQAIALALAYVGGFTATFYLEGGQAARFMASNAPPHTLVNLKRVRSFLLMDRLDGEALNRYIGTRQFLTLGVTTLAGLAFSDALAHGDSCGLDAPEWIVDLNPPRALAIFAHLWFGTTLFQVVPQLRAQQDMRFGDSLGCAITFHICEIGGKILPLYGGGNVIVDGIYRSARVPWPHLAAKGQVGNAEDPYDHRITTLWPHASKCVDTLSSSFDCPITGMTDGKRNTSKDFFTERPDVEGLPANPEHDVPPHIIFFCYQLIVTAMSAPELNLPAADVAMMASCAISGARTATGRVSAPSSPVAGDRA